MTIQVSVRMPEALHEKLRKRCFKERESINTYIISLLEAALQPKKKEK